LERVRLTIVSRAGWFSRIGSHGSARRLVGAEQQHALAGERNAEIVLDIPHEADAVEILGDDLVILELQAVCRSGEPPVA
jgi:hypothetical protein